MDTVQDLLSSLTIELKRGTLVLLVLSQLHTEEYGYSLVRKLDEKQLPIEPGTLYPLLRRLEKQGLLTAEWDTTESRPRKFYLISDKGKEIYPLLKHEWRKTSQRIEELLKEEETDEPD